MHDDGGRAEWLDLHKMRLFAAVAEQEHYRHAAERLGISQPALSTHVRDLEAYLGVSLFERSGRGVCLTEAGRLVHSYARRILALARDLDDAVADLRALRAGELRLGASTTIGEYLLPAALGAFRKRHPNLNVAVEIGNTTHIVDRLRHGELHLALIGEPSNNPDLELAPYLDDEIVLIVAPSHRWAGATVALTDLPSEPLVAREPGSATRGVAERALTAAGVSVPIGLELGGTEAVKRAVIAGLGVAFVSACSVADELAAARLSRVNLPGLTIKRQFQVARRRGRRLTPSEEAFLLELRASYP